ncbi:MAG TPA: hypothetical protein PK625_00975 [Spirochaetales bacterium]|nr:hypothetical protein [Spirochaetales bacterium]
MSGILVLWCAVTLVPAFLAFIRYRRVRASIDERARRSYIGHAVLWLGASSTLVALALFSGGSLALPLSFTAVVAGLAVIWMIKVLPGSGQDGR